jgi:hypothetical protein
MSLPCAQCGASILDVSIDRAREIATCPSCGRVVDLRAQASAEAKSSAAPRMRAPVPLPTGMQLTTQPPSSSGYREAGAGGIAITRRWLRPKHYGLLLVPLIASGVVAFFWAQHGFSFWVLFGALFVAAWTYMLTTMFVNRTVVSVGSDRVEVRHGPLPNLVMARNTTLEAANVRQLFAARHGAAFAVKAQLSDGSVVDLVAPLTSAEQAIFVEQQLERALSLVDFAVEDELGADYPAAVGTGGSKKAAGGAAVALLGPLIAAAGVGMFFYVSSTTVEGSLTATPELGGFTLTPDDCSSGQRQGFHGVELWSSADSSRRVRLVRDAVLGDSVVIEESSPARRTVLGPERCPRFRLAIEQTDTNINEVWVMEGSASLDCDVLSGQVSFAGCH